MNTPSRVTPTTTRAGALRRTAALALVACGAALLITPAIAGAESVENGDVSAISIVQTPDEVQGECQPAILALSNTHVSTPTSFTLTVVASAPLCEPITATAAVYGMPGNGEAWPQELVETKDFTISAAGTTVITFTKDCAPVQFDVVTGATPQTIAPWAEKHGPLLFPLDDTTAEQYFGCTPETTTTTSTTTTSTTTSTVPPEVLGTTTIAPTTSTTLAPQTAQVEAANVTRATTSPANAKALALTGSSSSKGVVAGLVLIGLGAVLFIASRRRHANA